MWLGSEEIAVALPPGGDLVIGDDLAVALPPDRLHLFSAATGRRIAEASRPMVEPAGEPGLRPVAA